MKRSSLGLVLLLVTVAAMAARCTDLTVTRSSNGTISGTASGPETPLVDIDEEGAHEPPTPTPGPYQPVYPVTPPPPTETPRPA